MIYLDVMILVLYKISISQYTSLRDNLNFENYKHLQILKLMPIIPINHTARQYLGAEEGNRDPLHCQLDRAREAARRQGRNCTNSCSNLLFLLPLLQLNIAQYQCSTLYAIVTENFAIQRSNFRLVHLL